MDILTSQSLFSNYFTHYGAHCAAPPCALSIRNYDQSDHTRKTLWLDYSLNKATDKIQYYHNVLHNLKLLWKSREPYILLLDFIRNIVCKQLFPTLAVIRLKQFLSLSLETVWF